MGYVLRHKPVSLLQKQTAGSSLPVESLATTSREPYQYYIAQSPLVKGICPIFAPTNFPSIGNPTPPRFTRLWAGVISLIKNRHCQRNWHQTPVR